MSENLVLAVFLEALFITLTALLLIQPRILFQVFSQRTKTFFTWGGLFFLCFTFCWSVVVGIIIELSNASVRL